MGVLRKRQNSTVHQEVYNQCRYDKNAKKFKQCKSKEKLFNQTFYHMENCTLGLIGECDENLGLSCQKSITGEYKCGYL